MSTLPLLPLGPRVLLLPHTPEKRSRGGIELPDSAQVQQPYGTILAISPDLIGKSPVGVGSEVYFAPYAGSEVRVTNPLTGVETIYLLLLLDDLIAVKTPTEVSLDPHPTTLSEPHFPSAQSGVAPAPKFEE
jgi:co-chaperonin GroES (HSP10)